VNIETRSGHKKMREVFAGRRKGEEDERFLCDARPGIYSHRATLRL